MNILKILKGWILVAALVLSPAAVCGETRLTAGTIFGFPGAHVEVPVRLKLDTNAPPEVVGIQADLHFDADRVRVGEAIRGGALQDNHVILSRSLNPNVYRFLVYSAVNRSLSNGVVATLPFAVAGGLELANIPLLFSNVVVAGPQGRPVELRRLDGAIVMTPVYRRVDGTVDYFLSVQPDQRYVIQASTNLIQWENVSTNDTPDTLLFLVDEEAKYHSYRFYRAVLRDPVSGLQIGTIRRLDASRMAIQFQGSLGKRYVLESSTNLVGWTSVITQAAMRAEVLLTNSILPQLPSQFFRIRELP